MSYEESLHGIIYHHPTARGLAVIVANKSGPQQGQYTLTGVEQDFVRMVDTFEKLKFGVLPCKNVSKDKLIGVVHGVASFLDYPESYRRIVFVLSGHGIDHFIFTHDGKVDINRIVDSFQPCNAPHLGSIPKMFFIDVCRGTNSMQPVFSPRGGEVITKVVPQFGNCLVAYSTLNSFKAFESKEGGIWMTLLSEKLLTLRGSIVDVLIDVNRALNEKYQDELPWKIIQQPTFEGTLNEHVKLLEEAESENSVADSLEEPARPQLRRLVSLPPVFTPTLDDKHGAASPRLTLPNLPPGQQESTYAFQPSYPTDSQNVVAMRMVSQSPKQQNVSHPRIIKQLSEPAGGMTSAVGVPYSLEQAMSVLTVNELSQNEKLLQRYQREGKFQSFKYFSMSGESAEDDHMHQVVIALKLDGNTTFECAGEGPFEGIAKMRAEEKAIQFVQNKEKSAERQSLENGTTKCSPLGGTPVPTLNYRQKFNEWCQERGLKPQKNFNCHQSMSNQISHQCTIEYTACAQTVYFVSGHHTKKKHAEEEAAKRALEHVALTEQFDLKFSARKTPVKVLQECCEKIHGDQLHNPQYETTKFSEKSLSPQKFQSTVSLQVEGRMELIHGDMFTTIAEAKHSAALRALYRLGAISVRT